MPFSVPNHSLHPLTAPDIPTFAAVIQASKLQLVINRFLFKDWPNEAAQREHNLKAVEANFTNPDITRFKVMDDGTGGMVAHLVVMRCKGQGRDGGKGKGRTGEKGGGERLAIPEVMEPEVHGAVMQAMGYINQDLVGVDRLDLAHIYVTPSNRRYGIGAQLMQLAIELARKADVPLTVASEPQAHGFFLKQGLVDTRHFDVNLRKWADEYCGFGVFRIWGMRSGEVAA